MQSTFSVWLTGHRRGQRANPLDAFWVFVGLTFYSPFGVAEKRHTILNDTRKMYYRHWSWFFWTAPQTAGRALVLGIHLWHCSAMSFLTTVRLFNGVWSLYPENTHSHTHTEQCLLSRLCRQKEFQSWNITAECTVWKWFCWWAFWWSSSSKSPAITKMQLTNDTTVHHLQPKGNQCAISIASYNFSRNEETP